MDTEGQCRALLDATSGERLLQIGEVAEGTGLSLRTIRYYEEVGLIVPETRTDGGFRLYTDDQLHRLALIRRMKPLGFTLEEMREVLETRDRLYERPDDAAASRRLAELAELGAQRRDDLDAKARRGGELVELLRRESRGEVVPGVPPEFFES